MKLYIPTSSLNADNILSCECITPARECRKRVFGYSHFETLEELRQFDYCTIAFSKVPRFNIFDDSRENYRMVVEIDLASPKENDLSHVGTCEDTDIFATANPIHLSPANTRLLFYKREEMDYVYHNCSDSAKCKFFDFFKYGFSGINLSEQGAILANCLENINIQNVNAAYSENTYNKVKGFIWGYAIGCMLSRTSETANLLRIQKRIYDIISSTRYDTYIQDALKCELAALDSEYTKFDPIQRLAKKRWNEYIKTIVSNQPEFGPKVTIANIDKLLQELGVETAAKSKFLSEQNLTLRKPFSSYSHIGTIGYEQYNQDLVTHTKSAIFHENMERLEHISLKDYMNVDLVSYNSVMLSSIDEKSDFFNKILYRIIWNNLIPSHEEIRINRKDVAVNVVKTLKAIMEDSGTQWQDSEVQAYFDRMRKNISKYEPFELTDISDPVLQSVAAFVLKGEDYESLKSYLEVNAICDYRYALAMWGAMIGYVSIPRSLLDGFNRSAVTTLYHQVESVLGNSDFTLSYSVPQITLQPDPQNTYINNESSEQFHRRVIAFFESTIVKNQKKDKKESLREGLNRALDEFGDDTNPIKFVSLLNDFVEYGWKPSLKPWQTLRDYLAPDYVAKTSRSNVSKHPKGSDGTPSFQSELTFDICAKDSSNAFHTSKNSHRIFTSDENAIELIKCITSIPDDLKKNIIANIRYIQKAYQPGGYYFNRKDASDNANVIDHLIRWCTYEKNRYNRIEKNEYNSSVLDMIKEILIKYYCCV